MKTYILQTDSCLAFHTTKTEYSFFFKKDFKGLVWKWKTLCRWKKNTLSEKLVGWSFLGLKKKLYILGREIIWKNKALPLWGDIYSNFWGYIWKPWKSIHNTLSTTEKRFWLRHFGVCQEHLHEHFFFVVLISILSVFSLLILGFWKKAGGFSKTGGRVVCYFFFFLFLKPYFLFWKSHSKGQAGLQCGYVKKDCELSKGKHCSSCVTPDLLDILVKMSTNLLHLPGNRSALLRLPWTSTYIGFFFFSGW